MATTLNGEEVAEISYYRVTTFTCRQCDRLLHYVHPWHVQVLECPYCQHQTTFHFPESN
jgi:hypothetical protein